MINIAALSTEVTEPVLIKETAAHRQSQIEVLKTQLFYQRFRFLLAW